MSQQINTDSAGSLALYFRKGMPSVPKTFSFFNEDETDYDLSALEFEMNFKDEEHSATNLFRLINGDGLTINENNITFEVSAARSLLGKDFTWWELRETTTNRTWLCKKGAYFFYGDPVEFSDTTEVTVRLQGDTVNVTISTGSSVDHWRGGWDASGNTFPTTGGSGDGGAIQNGDQFYISNAGGGILTGADGRSELRPQHTIATYIGSNTWIL
jgi:hypothetical protein